MTDRDSVQVKQLNSNLNSTSKTIKVILLWQGRFLTKFGMFSTATSEMFRHYA